MNGLQNMSGKCNKCGEHCLDCACNKQKASPKRFIVFWGDIYYPSGGWRDQKELFDCFEGARGFMRSKKEDHGWAHVVDLTVGEICCE